MPTAPVTRGISFEPCGKSGVCAHGARILPPATGNDHDMLETLRRGASGWLAKIMLSVLVLSFALWGVPEFIRQLGPQYLAQVGKTEISSEEYQQAFRRELDALSNQFGRRITPEQAKAFGLDTRVLQRLIGSAAIDTHARELGINISEATLVKDIEADPNFHGADGRFSRQQFEGLLRQANLSERGYVELRRQDDVRQILTSSMASAIVAPQPAVDLMHAYNEEMRSVEHFAIDPAKTVKVAEPDEAKLKEAYEKGKAGYMTPEYRSLAVLTVTNAAIKSRVPVTDEEIKASFEADKSHYDVPEKRHILQIAFKDKAAAEKAKSEIAAGKSFADVAKEAGAKGTDIDLGVLTRKNLIDPKIADAAFALAKDAVSDAVEGRFATVLLKVTEIQPGKHPLLDEVKDQVREKVFKDKAGAEIQKLRDAVEDARAAQKPLKQAAEELKLPFVDVAAVDRQSMTPEGKPALDMPGADAIVAAGFESEVGVEHDAIDLADGGYAWVDLKGVTPPKQKTFEEVKDAVKASVMAAEKQRLVVELAAKLVERADKGEAMATLAAEAGGKLDTASEITRRTLPQGLTKAAVTLAFGLAKDKAGTTDTEDKSSRIVLKVTAIKPAPPPTKAQTEQLAVELKRQLENDVIGTYVAALEQKLGTKVNQAMLKRVMGSEGQ